MKACACAAPIHCMPSCANGENSICSYFAQILIQFGIHCSTMLALSCLILVPLPPPQHTHTHTHTKCCPCTPHHDPAPCWNPFFEFPCHTQTERALWYLKSETEWGPECQCRLNKQREAIALNTLKDTTTMTWIAYGNHPHVSKW